MVRPVLQFGLIQQPTTACSGSSAASSRAITRISGATTLGRTPSARAIYLGDRFAARSSRARVSSSSSSEYGITCDLLPDCVVSGTEAERDTREPGRGCLPRRCQCGWGHWESIDPWHDEQRFLAAPWITPLRHCYPAVAASLRSGWPTPLPEWRVRPVDHGERGLRLGRVDYRTCTKTG
jgi:hypothetical protein